MPQRVIGLGIAATGLLFVICLLLMRFDIRRAARTGPCWKRNLVLAGIFLLASLGFVSCSNNGSGVRVCDTPPTAEEKDTDRTAQWKRLNDTWNEAQEIASGKRGAYPFDRKGKERILKDLETAKGDVDTLEKAGLMSSAEAQLLKKDLAVLVAGVNKKVPVEMRPLMCYSPTMFIPAKDSAKRLAERLPLLEKLTESEKLRPEVVEKVLATVEKDIATLENERNLGMLPQAEREEAIELREKVRAHVQKIKAALKGQE